ncbi:MAG TPA: signal recognition particle protein [Bacilli bacterium]|nr:signal recognition particle protein [Bacilli bacterium]
MPFESLSERLQMSIRRITGRGKLNETDIDEMMKEVRLSLLEADVNYKVVKNFTNEVKQKAIGDKIMKSLTPGEQVVKVVHEELKALMGTEAEEIKFKPVGTTVILVAGLQGSGKTTHCGKLANFIRKTYQKKSLMIAADIYRPAAITQLVTLGKQLDVDVFELGTQVSPVEIVKKGLVYGKEKGYDVIIIDTAGRLHIDDQLMHELEEIKKQAKPDEILLTVDAMTGQDAVNIAQTFHTRLSITGCLLTKLDSDSRGGAALSIRYLTGIPIKFIGLGEKLDQIEVFHPERMASRILGMGDVLTLIEKATQNIDEDEALKMTERLQKGLFNYNDFLKQLNMIRKIGSLKGILGMLPGVGSQIKNLDLDDKQFNYIEAIISSMTEKERKNPELIAKSTSRKERISKGSGRSYQEVNQLTKRFDDMKTQLKAFTGMDEKQMNALKSGRPSANMMPAKKVKKGKGKNRGNFRF